MFNARQKVALVSGLALFAVVTVWPVTRGAWPAYTVLETPGLDPAHWLPTLAALWGLIAAATAAAVLLLARRG